MSRPLLNAAGQLALYDQIGYRQTLTRKDGSTWTMPAEQRRFLLNWEQRYHITICPARSSKSYSAAKKVLPLVLGTEAKRDGSGPVPTRGWIVGPTYDLASKEYRYILHDLMAELPKLGYKPPPIHRDGKSGDLYTQTAWGSEIVGKSADKPQSLLGEQLDWVLLSEAAQLPGEIWTRYLEPRLATTGGHALFPTTPDGKAMWLFELYSKGVAGTPTDPATGKPIFAAYSWDVYGNPVYPSEELELARAKYGTEHPVFQEQYLGKWTFQHGRVYGQDFDVGRNVMDPREIPRDWRRIRAIDFGYRDPFVCLWFAITPDSELWLYREYYHPGRSMAHHAQAIRELSKDEHVLYTVADSSEPQSIADLRRLGVPAIEAKRDRRAGRMLVGDYLRDGRLRFVRGACPETLREISWYHWDEDKNKEGAKEATLGDDHAMDAMRYAIMSRPVANPKTLRRKHDTFDATMQRRAKARAAASWAWAGR